MAAAFLVKASVLAAKRKRDRSELESCRSEPTVEVHIVRVEGKTKHLRSCRERLSHSHLAAVD